MISRNQATVTIEDTHVLQDISLSFQKGKNYCILGKNGSGKSSLALTTMGHPSYEITQGDITIDGESIKDMSPDERAQRGIFLAFQSIPEIK
jgi:Fe-S cluster assembly ATP-binding protein